MDSKIYKTKQAINLLKPANSSPRISLLGINPKVVELFCESFGLDSSATFSSKPPAISYLDLRKTQNEHWARSKALEGIEMAKIGDLVKAKELYDLALDLDDNCVDAYIGRGCLSANEKKLRLGIEDLKMALSIDPDHKNAKMYLETMQTKQKKNKAVAKSKDKRLMSGEFLLPASFSGEMGVMNMDHDGVTSIMPVKKRSRR